MKRLFELFYRPDNELTRTTAGTGIGLALVKQFVTAMAGRVDVKNQDPGAEFRLVFPTTGST
jgi:signal transduction histidine kinase